MVKENKEYILKVRKSKANNQKTVTIPKEAEEMQEGDYVRVKKHE